MSERRALLVLAAAIAVEAVAVHVLDGVLYGPGPLIVIDRADIDAMRHTELVAQAARLALEALRVTIVLVAGFRGSSNLGRRARRLAHIGLGLIMTQVFIDLAFGLPRIASGSLEASDVHNLAGDISSALYLGGMGLLVVALRPPARLAELYAAVALASYTGLLAWTWLAPIDMAEQFPHWLLSAAWAAPRLACAFAIVVATSDQASGGRRRAASGVRTIERALLARVLVALVATVAAVLLGRARAHDALASLAWAGPIVGLAIGVAVVTGLFRTLTLPLPKARPKLVLLTIAGIYVALAIDLETANVTATLVASIGGADIGASPFDLVGVLQQLRRDGATVGVLALIPFTLVLRALAEGDVRRTATGLGIATVLAGALLAIALDYLQGHRTGDILPALTLLGGGGLVLYLLVRWIELLRNIRASLARTGTDA